jgi:tetratricopeptide (TPR) repeat protein
VNIAIELNPNLAIAYGRRGSIYYKLGDTRRATLNWNVALQLDPEFTEIYDILQAADENRLKHIEIGKTQENIR